jgi:hypothetical protein
LPVEERQNPDQFTEDGDGKVQGHLVPGSIRQSPLSGGALAWFVGDEVAHENVGIEASPDVA